MLEKINTPGYESLSKPSNELIQVIEMALEERRELSVAEIGLGIGATTVEILDRMDGSGVLHLFDFVDIVDGICADIEARDLGGGVKVVPHPNGRQTFNSYAWTLATMARSLLETGLPMELFDVVYLDAAHSFHHDAPACVVLREMLKPGGYIVFDDMYWSFDQSPKMNPTANPEIVNDYSREQLAKPHVEMVVNLFIAPDPRFEQVYLTEQRRPYRPVFRRAA